MLNPWPPEYLPDDEYHLIGAARQRTTGGSLVRYATDINGNMVGFIGPRGEILGGAVDVRAFSHLVVGGDWTAAIQAALNTGAKEVYLGDQDFPIVDPHQDGTPTLTSDVPNRTIYGPGRITATARVYKALQVTGAGSKIHVKIAGNNLIAHGVEVAAHSCEVSHCVIEDLGSAAGEYSVMAVRAVLNGMDASVRILDNQIRNLNAVGDGVAGNGVGMTRAIGIEGDQPVTKLSTIALNTIENVMGEEGDAIVLVNSSGGVFHDLPTLVTGNTVVGWTRRAVKVQSNKAFIVDGNTFRNTFTSNPGNLQHAVSLVQGGGHIVNGNTFDNCRYAGQVVLNSSGPAERFDTITIDGNVIVGLGAETTHTPIYVNSYGENVTVTDNKILCPALGSTNIIGVVNALSGAVHGNVISAPSVAPYLFTGSVNVLTGISSLNESTPGLRTVAGGADAMALNVFGSTNRSLTLYNWDNTLSDGEVISRIQFHQDDNGTNVVTASMRAVAVGSTGSTAITIGTGSTGTPDVERFRIKPDGQVRMVPLAAAPANAQDGDVYYDSVLVKLRVRAGGAWVDLH